MYTKVSILFIFLLSLKVSSDSNVAINITECNGDLQKTAKDLLHSVTLQCLNHTKAITALEKFFHNKHACSTWNKFKHSYKTIYNKSNQTKSFIGKYKEIFMNYIYGGLYFLCRSHYNITNQNPDKMQQLGINIFEIIFNTTSVNLKRFCDFPRKHHKNKCSLDLDNELFYSTYGFVICNSEYDRMFYATWPILSIVYSEFMEENNTHIIEAFSGTNYPYLSEDSIKMLYNLVAYDEYTIYHRRNIKYQSIIKHLRETRQILGSPFILNSITITALQAHKMFSGHCRFIIKSEEHGTTIVDCNHTKSNNENEDKNIFYVFVEYNIYRTIIIIIFLITGLFINSYFAVLLKDCWNNLNCQNRILMASFVGAYLILLVAKFFHYLRPYFYNDFMEKNFIQPYENHPGLSMVNKTYSLLVWTILYTFKKTGVTIAVEETIFRTMNILTCIIGFVIMINTFADMLFLLKKKQQIYVSYHSKRSLISIVSCVLGLAILILFVASSILTYNSIYEISEIVHKMQNEKFAYLQICKYSDTLIEGKRGMTIYSCTSLVFALFYTLLTILFLLYYKLEQKTTNLELTFTNYQNLKATVYSLVGGYITYIVSNGYFDYQNICFLFSSGVGKNEYQRTFEISENAMLYQIFSILLLINPIIQPVLIILRLTEMKKQHCFYWNRFWEIGIYESITKMLWYPVVKIYLLFKYLNCRECRSSTKIMKIKKHNSTVVMEKKFPKYPTFTMSLKKNCEINTCDTCVSDNIDSYVFS